MTKILLSIILFSSVTWAARGGGSGGFRGGGDAINAEFLGISSQFLSATYETDLGNKFLEYSSRLKIATLYDNADLETILSNSAPTSEEISIYLDACDWQKMTYKQKVLTVINLYIRRAAPEKDETIWTENYYKYFETSICMESDSRECKKLRNQSSEIEFPNDIPEDVIFKETGFKFFNSVLNVSRPGNDQLIVLEIIQQMQKISVLLTKQPLLIDHNPVAAINMPFKKVILLSTTKWHLLDYEQKLKLIIHEYISVLGYDDTDYKFTYDLFKRLYKK